MLPVRPSVCGEAGPTAGRQVLAGKNVPVSPDRAWWPAVGPRLDRTVKPHFHLPMSQTTVTAAAQRTPFMTTYVTGRTGERSKTASVS